VFETKKFGACKKSVSWSVSEKKNQSSCFRSRSHTHSDFCTRGRTRTDIPDSYRDVNTMVIEAKKFGAFKKECECEWECEEKIRVCVFALALTLTLIFVQWEGRLSYQLTDSLRIYEQLRTSKRIN
jgi:hypothetical protein